MALITMDGTRIPLESLKKVSLEESGMRKVSPADIAGTSATPAETDAAQFAAMIASAVNASARTATPDDADKENRHSATSFYNAQEIAQRTEEENEKTLAEFFDYMKKSPAERIRDQILRDKNITEEELAAMPPEQRAAIEQEIADTIKMAVERGVAEEKMAS